MSSASSVASSRIVLEVLTGDNYDKWSVVVRNYLQGKNLWDVVEDNFGPVPIPLDIIQRKNAMALHIIQRSCNSKVLAQIRHLERAQDAWNHLRASFSTDLQGNPDNFLIIEQELHWLVERGEWEFAREIIDINPMAIYSTSNSGRTVLHVAVIAGHENIVRQLVIRGGDRLVEIQDNSGYTALALAAELTENTNIARFMVEVEGEGGQVRENLLTMTTNLLTTTGDRVREIPVLLAAANGHKKMTGYLYNQTPFNMLFGENVRNGGLLLTRCIKAEIFDVALKLLQRDARAQLPLTSESYDLRPLNALVRIPSAFLSSTRFGLGKQFLYNILRLDLMLDLIELDQGSDEITIIIVPRHNQDERFAGRFCRPVLNFPPVRRSLLHLDRLLGSVQMFVQEKILLRIPGIRQLYDQKLTHYLVLEILNCFRVRISTFNNEQLQQSSAYDAMLQAAKYGIVEFIEWMRLANPNLLWAIDKNKRGIFSHAILNRRKKVFQLIDRENARKDIIKYRTDEFGNNLLHLAGHLGPSSYLDRRPGAALQMQREIQWFKAVKGIVHPSCKDAKNADGKTPSEVFTESHKELVKDGQEWAKDTVRSFAIVGTLIITAMFSTAFNIPGGEKDGKPIFMHNNYFSAFIIVGAIGLFSSSSSILIFIRILTSRLAEKDFRCNLPRSLFWGLSALLLSVLCLLLVFCLALCVILKGDKRIQIGALSLASIPLLIFVPSQLLLLFQILKYTVRSNVFRSIKKGNNVYKYSITFR